MACWLMDFWISNYNNIRLHANKKRTEGTFPSDCKYVLNIKKIQFAIHTDKHTFPKKQIRLFY